MKKKNCVALVILLVITQIIPSGFASVSQPVNESQVVMVQKSAEEMAREWEKIEKEILESFHKTEKTTDVSPQNDPSDYKIEWSGVKYAIAEGFASGQPSAGTKFPTGGGFTYQAETGIPITVSVSFPEPFGALSVAVNLGGIAPSGYFISAPNKVNHFKLYTKNVYEVKKYITYKKQMKDTSNPWSEIIWVPIGGGSSKSLYTRSAWAVRMD